ncbi:MAG: hypothetical protein GKR91_03525 [Pseudomonadales bacterium]|nr:hypothetical protein [Pseudomonadales bacterium]
MLESMHDPSEYIRGLQQLLVSDKKKIAFLFGAGTSLSKKNDSSINIPAIGKMTEDIEKKLNELDKNKAAINEIRDELKTQNRSYNIETLLTNVEQKIQIIGSGTLNGLVKEDFKKLLKDIKKEIRETVGVHKSILEKDNFNDLIHVDFAEWIGRANRKYPIEIFTTNYDYLFELGLEEKNIPYYDGFTGSYQPFFNSESIEALDFVPNQTKLWKIHGSLGWHFDDIKKKVWRKDSDSEDILIYPSSLKYSESKKQPYMALMDRLTNYLKQPDTVLITCGYSFGDEHINERIVTALSTNTSGHVISLFHDIVLENKKKNYLLTKDSDLTKLAKENKKLSVYGCRHAVIGGQYGSWKLKREPDKDDTINIIHYFDEDAPCNPIEEKKERKGDEIWTGEGELFLPDFTKFVIFLQSMVLENSLIGKGSSE